MAKDKFVSGQHLVICDRCSREYRRWEVRTDSDNNVVCYKCYEPEHPAENIRMRAERVSPNPDYIRKVPTPVEVQRACSTREAIAGIAVAGCAIAGYKDPDIPEGTF